MAVLVDFQQVLIANTIVQLTMGKPDIGTIGKSPSDLCRHIILSQLKYFRRLFPQKEYGEMILCLDGADPWRRDIFPYYKGKRKSEKDKSSIDWDLVHGICDQLKKEAKKYFPYPVVRVERCEADDVIAILCREIRKDSDEPIGIVSTDADFYQLHHYGNVKQYAPIKKKFVKPDKAPMSYLLEQVLCGCTGDGIPNVLSDDDTFMVEGKRAKPMTQARISSLLKDQTCECKGVTPKQIKKNIHRNMRLVNLLNIHKYIPKDLYKKVLNRYEDQHTKKKELGRSGLLTYFNEKKMKLLIDSIGEF